MLKHLIFLFVFISCANHSASAELLDGKLSKCKNRPNCVSSNDKREKYFISPIVFRDASIIKERLLAHLKTLPRVKIIANTGNYIKSTFTSKIMRFTDDVEFYIDLKNKVIQVRSASRVGYSDWGVNRKRIEAIRKAL